MADPNPVRVRTTVTAYPPLQGYQIPPTVSSVIDPDDLARAIREGVDARLRDFASHCRDLGVPSVSYALARMLDPPRKDAPREPVQDVGRRCPHGLAICSSARNATPRCRARSTRSPPISPNARARGER